MADSTASWMTLATLFASSGWYIYRSADKNLPSIITSIMTGILCLFGGFLLSGAILKVLGSFDNPIIPALFVWLGTALCITAHTVYIKRKTTPVKAN